MLANLDSNKKLGNYSDFRDFEIKINFLSNRNVIQLTLYAALSVLASITVFHLYYQSITQNAIVTQLLLLLADVLVKVSVILQ